MSKKHELPKRVQEEITHFQYKSELVVGGLQLVAVFSLLLFYYLTPKTLDTTAPIFSEPMALLLFTSLVLGRLVLAYTNKLTPLFLGGAVVAEMVLLLLAIAAHRIEFSSIGVNLANAHINHLDYAFILIALRALRFEPIWVILSGLTAAMGWLCVLVYNLVAQDLAHYSLYGYFSIIAPGPFLGEELSIIGVILAVTAIIAFLIDRAQHILFQAFLQTIAVKELSRFFDKTVAEKITLSQTTFEAGHGETREAAILFTDMRGFTELSQKIDPMALIHLLGEYQRLVVAAIQRYGGNVDKFMGDGIMASFGAVTPSNTYAKDGLKAVDEIMEKIEEWNKRRLEKGEVSIKVGAALSSGQVIFGVIGSSDRVEYTVIGETVNLAAKLEKHNKIEHTRAIATLTILEKAIKQGYPYGKEKELRKGRQVQGIVELMDLVVLA